VWIYNQLLGEWRLGGILAGIGYSGFGAGKNNPLAQHLPDLGPIPCGYWTISGPPFDSPEHGPYCLRLDPRKGTETFGRSGFLIHGDSKTHPGEASNGCLIADHVTRMRIYQSGDRVLLVESGRVAADIDGEISV
jgi:hypothetical protein